MLSCNFILKQSQTLYFRLIFLKIAWLFGHFSHISSNLSCFIDIFSFLFQVQISFVNLRMGAKSSWWLSYVEEELWFCWLALSLIVLILISLTSFLCLHVRPASFLSFFLLLNLEIFFCLIHKLYKALVKKIKQVKPRYCPGPSCLPNTWALQLSLPIGRVEKNMNGSR